MSVRTAFLSSTIRDLSECRESAFQAIEGLDGWHCVRMETFGARNWESAKYCRARVTECDLYIGLVGHYYGNCPPSDPLSYTEREYEAAKAGDVPRLVFLNLDEDNILPAGLQQSQEDSLKQQAFRQRLGNERLLDRFTSPEDLALRVVQAIRNWEREVGSVLETTKGGPAVLPLRLASDGGHYVEILNRGETDVWDVVIENHEPREPPGIDQYRKGTLPFIRAGATEKAFLSDEQHTYCIDRPGYGLRITWIDRDLGQTLSADFFTAERKRGARFAIDDDASSVSSFHVSAISGEGFVLLKESETYAQLAIANEGQTLLRKCSVRLRSIDSVVSGHLWPDQLFQVRLLRWSSRELAAYGEHHQWLDIPNDGEEHILDVAVLDRSDLARWRIVSADPADRQAYGRGWYRLVVAIASESETPNRKRVELRLGLGSRTVPPPPLILNEWRDGDEKRLGAD